MTIPTALYEDRVLIERTLAGQTECFTILINRHLGPLSRRINSMVRNASDAEDIIQDVLLKAWLHLPKFRFEATFRTWVTRVAINEVLQQYRREQRSLLSPAGPHIEDFPEVSESPHQALARKERQKMLGEAIAELPPKYQQILMLRDVEQLSVGETARSLDASIPLVKSRLFRARRMLSAALHKPTACGQSHSHPLQSKLRRRAA